LQLKNTNHPSSPPSQSTVVMKDQLIPAILSGAHLMASSEHDSSHGVQRARLNYSGAREGSNSWCAGANQVGEWIQVSVPTAQKWVAIETQGRHGCGQWVTSYLVKYSTDGREWRIADEGRVFEANQDSNTIIRHEFEHPFQAKCVRIQPLAWYAHISLRCELYYAQCDKINVPLDSKRNECDVNSLIGKWSGNWGSGPLHFDIAEDGVGKVDIPGHSTGTCRITENEGVFTIVISRRDGLTQGCVVTSENTNSLIGTYVHFNCSTFSNMYLHRQ